MKRILLALGAILALAALPQSAFATASVATDAVAMCAPEVSVGTRGPRIVVNPNTSNSYSLGGNGCARMALADVGYFISQGFTLGSGEGALYAGPFTAQTTAANSPVLPANAYIEAIIVQETAGNALTGGLDVGVAGSSDATIVSAVAIAANCVCAVAPASILKHVFPTSGTTGPTAQQIFFNAHSSWNSGSINVTVLYRYF